MMSSGVTPIVEPKAVASEIGALSAMSPVGAGTGTFARLESNVRSYSRSFPVLFSRADGSLLFDQQDTPYIDFLCGAGSLNYGHNHPLLRDRLVEYICAGGIAQGLDLHTVAKAQFLETLETVILQPRGLDYVAQFPGPTGTNAVEAALKLARKVSGRQGVIAFTNAFHGVTLGALATTGSRHHRRAAGVAMSNVYHAPYDGYLGRIDTMEILAKLIRDPSSGVDRPAAVIVETVQGEGGLNVASPEWLRRLESLCRAEEVILIVDDIQTGCGRTAAFFSFEAAGIHPDMVTLSKSLSGFGLPLSLTLIRRDLDCWKPGEHNGTFRGNNHAFVTATAALDVFWRSDTFADSVREKGEWLGRELAELARRRGGDRLGTRGVGMMRGLVCPDGDLAKAVTRAAFRDGLILETSGPHGEVVKCMPALTTPPELLDQAMRILDDAVSVALVERDSQ